MRKLAWTALGFTAAVGLCEYVLPAGGLPYIAAALAVFSPLALLLRRGVYRRRAMILALSAAAGVLLWWGEYTFHARPSAALVGQDVQISALVTGYVERHPDYERVEVRVQDGAPRERALLYYYDGALPELEPGDTISVQIRVSDAMIRQGERSRIYTGQGVHLLGYIQQESLTVTGRARYADVRFFPQRLGRQVRALCDTLLPPDTAPLVKGLLTGDTAALEEDTENYTAMRTAGVMHIVAVSGMHIFALVGFVQLLLGKSRRTSLVCLPVIGLFTLMAGCRPSVVRAAVMQTVYLLGPLARRETDKLTSLSAALLLLLAADPMTVGGTGLQLSFACMLGFVYVLPALQRWMDERLPMDKRWVSAAASNVACTVSATVFSAPVAAMCFGQMPLLSLAANLLTLAVIECVFVGGFALCALGALWPGLGGALGWLLAWPVRWCMLVYRTVAALPVSSLSMTTVRSWLWLAGVYALFGLWYVLRRRGRRVPADVPVCLAVIGLCLTVLVGKLAVGRGEALVSVLDVGQGECVVLAGHEGTAVIDCGGNRLEDASDTAAGYLQSIGRGQIDLLVLTHLHADHAGSVETLLYRMPVGQLILPAGADDGDGMLAEILTAAQRQNVPVRFLEEQSVCRAGDLTLELLLPQGVQTNERGIVALASAAGETALIMGDAGTEAELALLAEQAVPDVDVLVAGHHGSKTATGELFLLAARPETAVISVGYNLYGHPSEEAMERMDTYGARIRRTDTEGTVTVRFGQKGAANG